MTFSLSKFDNFLIDKVTIAFYDHCFDDRKNWGFFTITGADPGFLERVHMKKFVGGRKGGVALLILSHFS